MESFKTRLCNIMVLGDLTVADIARLFDRERRTVSDWVNLGREPTGARAQEAHDRLTEIERAVRHRAGYPVPYRLSKRNRVKYIRLVGEGDLEGARLLAKAAAA